MRYPSMVRIQQEFKTSALRDVPATLRSELERLKIRETIKHGASVAITAGSRGIANISNVTAVVISQLKSLGARPFIIPAMGSHGGGTSEGQKRVIEEYGITEQNMGAPIRTTMEVVEVGSTPLGFPVFSDRYAYEADHIVVINRIKPHCDFKASIESGLMKMMAIGLGKKRGADLYHRAIIDYGFYPTLLSVAREILSRLPIAFGIALVENQKHETAIIRAIPSGEIEDEERRLLRKAKRLMARLPFEQIDVLIVDRMGKEISGAGMDTNVIGRNVSSLARIPHKPKIRRIYVRDLTPQAHGNAIGIGIADFTTKRLVEKIDLAATYMNSITAGAPETAKIPPHFARDREAIDLILTTLGLLEPKNARVVHILDTLRLEEMEISEAMLGEIRGRADLSVIGSPRPMIFDRDGNLVSNLMGQ